MEEVCLVVTPGDQAGLPGGRRPARRAGCTSSSRRSRPGTGRPCRWRREFVAGRPFLHLVSDHVYLSDAGGDAPPGR